MNPNFLEPFLSSLSRDGFHITAGDYRRIGIVLRSEGAWTVTRLKTVLAALLAKNPKQEELFLRRFESFFGVEWNNALFAIEGGDAQAVDELRSAVEAAANLPPPPPFVIQSISPTQVYTGAGDFTLTILGENFTPALKVFVDGRPLTTRFFNERRVLAVVPSTFASLAGTRHVVVCGQGGEDCSNHISFEVSPKPENRLVALFWRVLGLVSFEQAMVFGGILLLAGVVTVFLTNDGPNPKNGSTGGGGAGGIGPGELVPLSSPSPTPTPQAGLREDLASKVYALMLLGLGALYCLYLNWLMSTPKNKPKTWKPDAPQHFPLEQIGGKSPPRLGRRVLDRAAESLRYYESDEASEVLDVDASVEASGQGGGLPTLIYQSKKIIPTVLIFEDAYAEPTAWNSISGEAAEGLRRRGVQVLSGKFFESPLRLHAPNQVTHQLDRLEEQKGNLLLLYFSDSKCFHEHNAHALRLLSRWPKIAWMELREPKFWDEDTGRVALHNIPVFPATPDGLLKAVTHLSAEHPPQRSGNESAADWRGVPVYSGGNLYTYVEYVLGDALPWAQACAMIQPVTLGLADRLRLKFLPRLPAERVGRLFALPNSTYNKAGLNFSTPILSVLRHGFTRRWNEVEQRKILLFILERIREVEPSPPESLAHLSWEYVYERVRLEVEPDQALRELAGLAQTPLRDTIKAEFQRVRVPSALPGTNVSSFNQIPLRRRPASHDSWKRLRLLTGSPYAAEQLPEVVLHSRNYLKRMGHVAR